MLQWVVLLWQGPKLSTGRDIPAWVRRRSKNAARSVLGLGGPSPLEGVYGELLLSSGGRSRTPYVS